MDKRANGPYDGSADNAVSAALFVSLILLIPEIGAAVGMLVQAKFAAAGVFVLLLVLTFALVLILSRVLDRRTAERKRAYTEKYITNIKLRNLELGELIFVHDSHERTLALEHGIPALAGSGELKIYAGDSGMDTAPLVDCIKRVLRDREKITEGMCACLLEHLGSLPAPEQQGGADGGEVSAPAFVPDMDFIRAHISVSRVYMDPDGNGGWLAYAAGELMTGSAEDKEGREVTADFSSGTEGYDFAFATPLDNMIKKEK